MMSDTLEILSESDQESDTLSRLEALEDGELGDEENDDDIGELGEDQNLDDDQDSDDDEPGDEGDDDEEEGEPTLAKYLGVDESQISVDENGAVFIATNTDGEIKQLPLSDVISGYQMQSSLTQNQMKLVDDRKTFDADRTRVLEETQQNLQTSLFMSEHMEKELLNEYNQIDWNDLRSRDPAEYTALRQDYADKAKGIEGLKQKAGEAIKEFQFKADEEFNANQHTHIAEERTRLLNRRPDLADQKVYDTKMELARKFLTDTYGITEEEISQIFDHRLVSMVLDAQDFHKGKAQVKAKTKGRKIPKFQKPGARRDKGTKAARAAKATKKALKESGSSAAVAAAIVDRM